MLQSIPWQCVPNVWATVAPMLQATVDRSQKDYIVEDILHFLSTRDMQLWIWVEDFKIVACCVTQIVVYPRHKVCQVPFVAGKSLKLWINAEEEIGTWAKSQGCDQLEGFCRDGWLKILSPRRWFKAWITMRKDI